MANVFYLAGFMIIIESKRKWSESMDFDIAFRRHYEK